MKRLLLLLVALLAVAPVYADCVLRQSDAIELPLGPFVDATDGVTPEASLTISQGDVQLKKCTAAGDCGAFAQKNETTAASADGSNGWYEIDLDTTDTGTVGLLQIAVYESGALPVFLLCQVVEEAVYDSCCAGSSAPLDSTAVQTAAAAALNAEDGANFTNIPSVGSVTDPVTVGTNNDKTNYGLAADAVSSTTVAASAGTEIAAAVSTAQGTLTGTCDSGSTTTCVDNALTQANASQLEDRLICFDDSWCALITTFTPGTDTATTTKTAPSTRASKAYTIFPATLE